MVALRQTFGIARYLAVRDQIDDLLAKIDSLQMIRRRLNGAPSNGRNCRDSSSSVVSLGTSPCNWTVKKLKPQLSPTPQHNADATTSFLSLNGLAM